MFSPSLPFKKKTTEEHSHLRSETDSACPCLWCSVCFEMCGAFSEQRGSSEARSVVPCDRPPHRRSFCLSCSDQAETVRPALAARDGDCSVSGEREASASPRLAGRQLPIAQTRRAITDSCPTSPALHRQHQKDYCKLLFMVPHFIAERGLSDTSWK